MAIYEFKGGCAVHVEFQARTVEELKEVCELLKSYQFSFNGGDKGNGGASHPVKDNSYQEKISEERLDELFALAKKKNVMLKDLAKDEFGKTYLTSLTMHEGKLLEDKLTR